jgi:beta-ribofuranosylaminobenzene 5'-phosphate synthase
MSRYRIRTPSRLHFGLLAWGPQAPRQFGGVGLMIESPALVVSAEPAPETGARGPLSGRALEVARAVAEALAGEGVGAAPCLLRVERAPAEHVGLGVGTQLSLAVARLMFEVSGLPPPTLPRLSALTGRGRRSGIGLHGFAHGGLIVDGGRKDGEGLPPLLVRVEFPADWKVLVIQPSRFTGLHGEAERRAFAGLPPLDDRVTDRLCRLVLLGLLPALAERDLGAFGDALTELQQRVGQGFATAQGGIFARPELAAIAEDLRSRGLHGVGQSSWGPTLYAFSDRSDPERQSLLEGVRREFNLDADSCFWTGADRGGARVERID